MVTEFQETRTSHYCRLTSFELVYSLSIASLMFRETQEKLFLSEAGESRLDRTVKQPIWDCRAEVGITDRK